MLPPASSTAASSAPIAKRRGPVRKRTATSSTAVHTPDEQEPRKLGQRRHRLEEGRRVDVRDRLRPVRVGVRGVQAGEPVAEGFLARPPRPSSGRSQEHDREPDGAGDEHAVDRHARQPVACLSATTATWPVLTALDEASSVIGARSAGGVVVIVIPPRRSDGDHPSIAGGAPSGFPAGRATVILCHLRLYPYRRHVARSAARPTAATYDGRVPNIALPPLPRPRGRRSASRWAIPISSPRSRRPRSSRRPGSAGSTSSRRARPIATGWRPTSTSTRSTSRTCTRATTARSSTSTTTTSSSSCTSRSTRRRPRGS